LLSKVLKANQDLIFENTPQGVNPAALVKKALFAIQNNPNLLNCDKDSLFMAVYESAVNGLEIGGIRSEAYLVPYGDKVQLIPGYKGLISLVRRTGLLTDVTMELVHEGDTFEMEKGDNVRLRHVPSTAADRQSMPVTHVYVIFHMTDGSKVRNVWTAAQINAHRDAYSEGYRRAERYIKQCEEKQQHVDDKKLSPWHKNWAVMAFKTLVRDAINRGRLPLSDAVKDMINRDEPVEASDKVVQGEAKQISYQQDFEQLLDEHGANDHDEQTLIESNTPPAKDATDVDTLVASGNVATLVHEQEYEPEHVPELSVADAVDTRTPGGHFALDLAGCVNLGQVAALEERTVEECKEDEERDYVRALCEARRDEIRAARISKKPKSDSSSTPHQ
jgi:recombination protein RecT